MKKSTGIILTIILTAVIYSTFGSLEIPSSLYTTSILIAITYGFLKKEINITHISSLFLIIFIFEYLTIELTVNILNASEISTVSSAAIHFGVQIATSILAVISLIFRVQISRWISKSDRVALTIFDGVTPWVYIYLTLIVVLTAIEYTIDHNFGLLHLSFIYDYYEVLIYLGMASVIGILLSMIICHEKDLKKQISDT
ncbi:hypothetical protein [Pseudoalteromonas aurantia]|uniref:Integral membrane protein n=1 Tax=Pseudoalteromonas aurantia 208 TaxID=1314867 RepID=A0ABR9EKN2_9GAMM|nr:hypothetical protein [Pseudoalteromonas aurantia]MBE0370969.1 hypothetical protein [Pseudoalteromonas aurantia 208]